MNDSYSSYSNDTQSNVIPENQEKRKQHSECLRVLGLDTLKIKPKNYSSLEILLSSGEHGKISLYTNDDTGEKVAIKEIDSVQENEKIAIGQMIKLGKRKDYHLNLVKYMDWFIHDWKFNIVQEYIDGKSLKEIFISGQVLSLKESGSPSGRVQTHSVSRPFRERVPRKSWICQIYNGLRYLHKHNIIHRDVHVQNIMIENGSQEAKLVDLDLMCMPFTQCDSCFHQHSLWNTAILSPDFALLYFNKDKENVTLENYIGFDLWALGLAFLPLEFQEKIKRSMSGKRVQDAIKLKNEALESIEKNTVYLSSGQAAQPEVEYLLSKQAGDALRLYSTLKILLSTLLNDRLKPVECTRSPSDPH